MRTTSLIVGAVATVILCGAAAASLVPFFGGQGSQSTSVAGTKALIGATTEDWRSDPFGPKLARGTATQFGAFEFNDIDTVNVFNGSVNLAVPLGQAYAAGGALDYQLVAHYNSNVVDIRVRRDYSQGGPGRDYPIAIPAAVSNAGVGWYVHLGRLVEPIPHAEYVAMPFIEREKRLSNGFGWQYIAQDGSVHSFHASVHGEAAATGQPPFTQPLYTRDGSYLRLTGLLPDTAECTGVGLLACAKVEMGDGTVQFFEKRLSWPDSTYNLDQWRLRSIHDRVGNAIAVNYFSDRWEVDDRYRGPQRIYWESDPWFSGRVNRVETTAFGGQTAVHGFYYSNIDFQRLNENGSVWETHQVGRLTTITRPDGKSYGFNAAQISRATLPAGGALEWQYIQALKMPSTFDCAPDEFIPDNLTKGAGSLLPDIGATSTYIARRKAIAADGVEVLKETIYLRGLGTSPQIPDQYCAGQDGIFTEPGSELTVGVFEKYKEGRGRFSIHYFSVWPFGRKVNALNDDPTPIVDIGGWKSEEFGQPFTRNETRAGYFLSSRTYECGVDKILDTALGTSPKGFAAQFCGSPLRSRYVLNEQDYSDCLTAAGFLPPPPGQGVPPDYAVGSDAAWECLSVNPSSRVAFQVFHDDDRNPLDGNKERSTLDVSHENDGFGNYRRVVKQGNFAGNGARDKRTVRKTTNAARGELDRLADGRIDTAADENGDGLPGDDDGDGRISTWTNVPVTTPWILTSYNYLQIDDADGKIFRQQVCTNGNTGLLNRIRVKKSTGGSAASIIDENYVYDEKEDPADEVADSENSVLAAGDYDGIHDVIYEYEYADPDDPGLATSVRIYGGDTQPLPAASVGSGCSYNFAAALAPKYRLTRDFQYGVLKSAKVFGSTTTVENNVILDQNTGLTVQSKNPSGVIVSSYAYDVLGRTTAITRNYGVDEKFTYCLPGYGGVCAQSPYIGQRVAVAESTKGALLYQKTENYYDELGRVFQTDSLHPDATDSAGAPKTLRVTQKFSPLGWATFVSSPQRSDVFNGSMGTNTTYDSFGRAVSVTGPDGSIASTVYRGIRETRGTTSHGVIDSATSVGQKPGTMIAATDRYGNVIAATEPISTTAGSAVCGTAGTACRTQTAKYDGMNRAIEKTLGTQTRLFAYDGRGFLNSERHPEIGGISGNGYVYYKDYDAVGNVGRKCDGGDANCAGAASLLGYEYDAEGRLSRVTDGASPYLVNTYGTTGNSNGALVSAQRYNYLTPQNTGGALSANGSRRITYLYTYEPIGKPDTRSIEVHDTTTSNPFLMAAFTQSWDYDDSGRVRTINYPRCTRLGCAGTDTARSVTVKYGKGAMTEIATADNLGAKFVYHVNGQLAAIAHGNTTGLRTDYFGIGPNRMRRTSSINLAAISAATPGHLNLGAHVYDGSGDLIRIGGTGFVYDFVGRLVKSYTPGFWGASQTFSYDQHDNMTTATPDTFGVNIATNRLSDAAIAYNTAGYVTQAGPYKMHYDDFGKQESMIFNPSGAVSPCNLANTTGNCWLYWYGPDGERVGGTSLLSAGGGDYYWTIRDLGGNTLRTYKSVNEHVRATEDFVYAGRLLIGGKDAATGAARHYHSDHLGSTRVATNAATGLGPTIRGFSPYGRSTGDSGVNASIAEWAAYEKDPNDLTRNLKARSYFDVWGRFFTPDPARDGWNLYAYAGNDPINTIDPTGLYGCPSQSTMKEFMQTTSSNGKNFVAFSASDCQRFLTVQADYAKKLRDAASALRTIADKKSRQEKLTRDEKDLFKKHTDTVGASSSKADEPSRLNQHASALDKAAAMMEANLNGNEQNSLIVLPFSAANTTLGESEPGGTIIDVNMALIGADSKTNNIVYGETIAHEALHNALGAGGTLGGGAEAYSNADILALAKSNPDDAIRNPQSLIQVIVP